MDTLQSIGLLVSLFLNLIVLGKIFISSHSNKIDKLEARVKELEEKQHQIEVVVAVIESKLDQCIDLLSKIERKIDRHTLWEEDLYEKDSKK